MRPRRYHFRSTTKSPSARHYRYLSAARDMSAPLLDISNSSRCYDDNENENVVVEYRINTKRRKRSATSALYLENNPSATSILCHLSADELVGTLSPLLPQIEATFCYGDSRARTLTSSMEIAAAIRPRLSDCILRRRAQTPLTISLQRLHERIPNER